MREGLECLELTRAFAVTHMCDCGVVWRLMVLGAEHQRAGARAFREGGRGWWERQRCSRVSDGAERAGALAQLQRDAPGVAEHDEQGAIGDLRRQGLDEEPISLLS